jgi:23S rRNA pseudouridine2605 synthase
MTEPENNSTVRLNKYLALQLGISRRVADELIEHRKVLLNSKTAQLGARVNPSDVVLVNNKPIQGTARYEYLAFHKPVGYVCSRRAQGDHPTIYALLPATYHALKPVGRLDRDSSGILLLTNDGDFAYQMTHPKFAKTKIYQVQLDHPLKPLHQQMISDFGIQLEDGVSTFMVERTEEPLADNFSETSAARVSAAAYATETRREAVSENFVGEEANKPTYEITMHEGRNRQIRRTFAALGYTVTHLHRTQFGRFSLGNLKPGKYEVLDIAK